MVEPTGEQNRRDVLSKALGLMGTAAFATLNAREAPAAPRDASPSNRGLPTLPHFAPTAKRVIYLFMAGGPSHIDLFDYHPEMRKLHGKELPDSVRNGQRITGMTSGQKSFPCVAPMFEFQRRGERGTWINDQVLPHTANVVDDLTIIRSMNTEAINHDPAITYINTGSQQVGRPSMGAWLSYGLGSLSEDLPAYVVMISVGAKPGQALYARLWEAACFLRGTRESVSGAGPIRCSTCPIRRASIARFVARCWTVSAK